MRAIRGAWASTLTLAVALPLSACGPKISMTDDIDLTWDFGLTLARFDEDLHTPYVKGAPVKLFVDADDDETPMRGWTVTSADPAVFRIERQVLDDVDQSGITVYGVAAAEGRSIITIVDGEGETVGTAVAEVVAPDRVELQAHGYLILGRDGEAFVSEARQLVGGTATYLVRYFRGKRELFGNSVLSVTAPETVTATPRTTFLFENREWLTLRSDAVGVTPIKLNADGEAVAQVNVTTVPEAEVDHVDLLGMNEKGRNQGEWLVVLAQAFDASGWRLFGVDFDWTLAGVRQVGEGDLFRYEFEPGQYELLAAERGDQGAAAMIHAGEGLVDSSNNLGCVVAPGRGRGTETAGGGLAIVALGVGLGLVVRRKQRRRSESH
jgi:hypothetical protein